MASRAAGRAVRLTWRVGCKPNLGRLIPYPLGSETKGGKQYWWREYRYVLTQIECAGRP